MTARRFLSLLMVAAMCLALLPVQAGAVGFDDFEDQDEIGNRGVIPMLTTLGILNGQINGSDFTPAPLEGVRRSVAALLKVYEAELEDLTGYQLAKLLLTKTGYDDGINSYTGSFWMENLSFADARKISAYQGCLYVTGWTVDKGTTTKIGAEDIRRSERLYGEFVAAATNVTALGRMGRTDSGKTFATDILVTAEALGCMAEKGQSLTAVTGNGSVTFQPETVAEMAASGTGSCRVHFDGKALEGKLTVSLEGGSTLGDMDVYVTVSSTDGGPKGNVLIARNGEPLPNTVIDVAAGGYGVQVSQSVNEAATYSLVEVQTDAATFWDEYCNVRGVETADTYTPDWNAFLDREEGDDSPLTEAEQTKVTVLSFQTENGPRQFNTLTNSRYAINPDSQGRVEDMTIFVGGGASPPVVSAEVLEEEDIEQDSGYLENDEEEIT